MSTAPTIVWFRDDLRLGDNPALVAAAERGDPTIAVYVLDEQSPGIRPLGGAAKWWLHHSLERLASDLGERGVPLVLGRGAAAGVIRSLVDEAGAGAVLWNRRYGAAERAVDTALKAALTESGVEVGSFGASLLFEPWTIRTGAGTPYSVFTPFWRACLAADEPRHPSQPPELTAGGAGADRLAARGARLDDWGLLPTDPDWAGGLRETWEPGERAAHRRLRAFLAGDLDRYADARDRLDLDATSRLSPHLRWGELSPHQVWHETRRRAAGTEGAAKFLSELGWREFAYHVLFHFPELATRNLRPEFDRFPWPPPDTDAITAWERGTTGIPVVDAAMRELWRTGGMHNRARMVAASFLTKNLLVDWRLGEQWFWDTLVDADPASNPFGWQWVAGSGADAAPYFRVFNPELQRRRFDPDDEYVRRWIPELDTADYPEPLVDLRGSRAAALAAYEHVTGAR
ncbi:cryptochrome/photolyase family protein [Agromyces marinus]|uniref:Deoxyribodipyrimidine photo-lyase n=1 Tax=Agromyces marinus TaxID=1389020 RepID=A0ABM8H0F0_9MICO|nr:deoxyribodipyrimidine photo-lyase [Agromyces marinus]UIP57631.1 Deoxyribodipyrimidine photo-lyase [Agromyces marinus]BDZ54214.1 deoxyribodipyrimidine photo-lyase [Agromyces marinus]